MAIVALRPAIRPRDALETSPHDIFPSETPPGPSLPLTVLISAPIREDRDGGATSERGILLKTQFGTTGAFSTDAILFGKWTD